MKNNINFKQSIEKIKPAFPFCAVLGGIAIGCAVGFTINLKTDLIDNPLLNPSSYSDDYKSIIGDYLTDEDSTFKVDSVEQENVSLDSPFVKELQAFSTKYINTLSSDTPEINLSDFYLEKSDDTFELIDEDLANNEPLYMMKKKDLKVISKDEGVLSADGTTATLKVVFEFTVEDILIKNDITDLFEMGSTYTQERTLYLKKSQDGTYKIYEMFINSPVKK